MKNMGDGVSNSGFVRTAKRKSFAVDPYRPRGRVIGLQSYSGRARPPSLSKLTAFYRRADYRTPTEPGMLAGTQGTLSNVGGKVTNVANSAYEGVSNAVNTAYSSASDIANRVYSKAGELGSNGERHI